MYNGKLIMVVGSPRPGFIEDLKKSGVYVNTRTIDAGVALTLCRRGTYGRVYVPGGMRISMIKELRDKAPTIIEY